MKKFLVALIMLMPFSVFASDTTIMFEIGMGFGKSGNVSHTKKEKRSLNLKLCKNRDSGRMTFLALRLQNNDVELHGARWWHDTKIANCNRDTWAVGLGYVLSTRGDGMRGVDNDKTYLKWTPGVAYTWGKNKNFHGQEGAGTNWRLHGNWQMFNRFAIGTGDYDKDLEVAVHRYGTFDPNHGEYFVSVGLGLKNLDDNRPKSSSSSNNNKKEPPKKEPPKCTKKGGCGDGKKKKDDDGDKHENNGGHDDDDDDDDDDGHKHENNGGGNGGEGGSPGRGHGANNDED